MSLWSVLTTPPTPLYWLFIFYSSLLYTLSATNDPLRSQQGIMWHPPPYKKRKYAWGNNSLIYVLSLCKWKKKSFYYMRSSKSMRFVWVGDVFLIANACTMFLDDTGKFHLQVFNITANNFLLCFTHLQSFTILLSEQTIKFLEICEF